MFRVGQKVICVDDDNFVNYPRLAYLTNNLYPRKGSLYTIRGFSRAGYIYLNEIRGKPHHWIDGFYEGGWFPSRFRPIVERKTDISALQALLNPANHKEHV